jgi:hypothetical protein
MLSFILRSAWLLVLVAASVSGASAATYYVDNGAPGASDKNAGTQAAPWKTIARAAAAKELKPGDTVLIASGVYRERADITVSGEPGRPITFAAAPRARVVLKGSELIRGPWIRVAAAKGLKEPYPLDTRRLWKIHLGEEFFADPHNPGLFADKSRRWLSQVFINDDNPLQLTGRDAIYNSPDFEMIRTVGKGVGDMVHQSFFFDSKDQTLYLNVGGEPGWYTVEVGVRDSVLNASKVHDVIVRGLEMRHNRQPGGQWAMVSFGECQRVVVEDCKVYFADFNGLGLGGSKHCVVRHCDLSYNGCTGMGMGGTEDCTVEDCVMMANNYRHFCGDWGVAAGMKNIPGNKRTIVRRCEVAYNIDACGIWFDTDNGDIRILDNVVHDNDGCGIFYEVNHGGAIIAGNLAYGNHGRGIEIAGSQNAWVMHNTLAENNIGGIVAMTRGKDYPLKNCRVLNNLMINNYITADNINHGADLVFYQEADLKERAAMGQASDYNVYADNSWTPHMRPEWNTDHTLAQWQRQFGQDKHSRQMKVDYKRFGTSFRVLTQEGLDVAGPLPEEVKQVWQPRNPHRVGAPRAEFPGPLSYLLSSRINNQPRAGSTGIASPKGKVADGWNFATAGARSRALAGSTPSLVKSMLNRQLTFSGAQLAMEISARRGCR